MSIKPADLLDLSNRLLEFDNETAWRSCASRAYYAAYHYAITATVLCPDNSHFVMNTGTHGRLIDKFESWQTSNQDHKKLSKQIAYVLKDMKRAREMADYDLDTNFRKQQALLRAGQIEILQERLKLIWSADSEEILS